jgi:drug/metabolite transporter superfamily protein YnfA
MLDADSSVNSSSQALAVAGPSSAPPAPPPPGSADAFQWTAGKVVLSLALFLAAGLCEIGGGWLVWQAVRLHKAWWMALLGAIVLFGYGLIPCAQPIDNFGRVYAVYGGFFIILSYLWGWAVDGTRPDTGDWVGSAIAVAGACVAFFWPGR